MSKSQQQPQQRSVHVTGNRDTLKSELIKSKKESKKHHVTNGDVKHGGEKHQETKHASPNDSASSGEKNSQYTKWVKQRASCVNCHAIFDEPSTFQCLHSFCTKCIRMFKVEIRGASSGYICPKCDEFCDKDLVRPNFLLTELVHFYVMMTSKGTITTCKQCQRPDPTHRCLDCKADFCSSCKKVHDGFELMRVSHRWISHSDIGKRIVIDKLMFCENHPKTLVRHNCVECDQIVCENCLRSTHATHANETIDQAVKRLTPELQTQETALENSILVAETSSKEIKARVAEICAGIETQAEDARKIHRKLTEKLNADLFHLLGEFEKLKTATQTEGKKLISNLDKEAKKAKTAVSTVDTTSRIAQGTSLLQELQSGVFERVKKMASENKIGHLPKANTLDDPQVVLVSQVTQVTENNTIGHIVSKNSKKTLSSSDIWLHPIKDLTSKHASPDIHFTFTAASFAQHFFEYNGNLWIPAIEDGKSKIMVYSQTAEFIKKIDLPAKVESPNAIIQTRKELGLVPDTEFAIMASDTGLFTITQKGHVVQMLYGGAFADVCLGHGQIYALEYNMQQVISFHFGEKGWVLDKIIDAKHAESGKHDTLFLSREEIHVASWWGDTITSYSYNGDKLRVYKEKLTNRKSQKNSHKNSQKALDIRIDNPRLCGGDASGALVFCDTGNRRVQMLLPDRQVALTLLQGLNFDPVHVVPKDENSIMVFGADNSMHHFMFN